MGEMILDISPLNLIWTAFWEICISENRTCTQSLGPNSILPETIQPPCFDETFNTLFYQFSSLKTANRRPCCEGASRYLLGQMMVQVGSLHSIHAVTASACIPRYCDTLKARHPMPTASPAAAESYIIKLSIAKNLSVCDAIQCYAAGETEFLGPVSPPIPCHFITTSLKRLHGCCQSMWRWVINSSGLRAGLRTRYRNSICHSQSVQ